MTIRKWPKSARPRERLLEQGVSALSDSELLAILIGHGHSGKSAVDVAHTLINAYGGLQGLFQADFKDIRQHKGIGLARFAQLQASLELGRRHFKEDLKNNLTSHNLETVEKFLIAELADNDTEVFACLFLNSQNHLLSFEILFEGSVNSIHVYARKIAKRALHHNASAVVLSHNHPAGGLEPSRSDVLTTQNIRKALALVDIRVLDHIIVANRQTTSMAIQLPQLFI